jgi:hypothetical protein
MRVKMKKILFYIMIIFILIYGLTSAAGFYLIITEGERVELPGDYLF